MLNVVSVEEAKRIIEENFKSLCCQKEIVSINDSCGRCLCDDVISNENVPSFSRSTMDGYAVKSADTFGSSLSIPSVLSIKGEILMGENSCLTVESGQCVNISTGGMLPKGADAVIPVEYADEDMGDCLVCKPVSPFENVTKEGDDVSVGQTVIHKGTRLKSTHIAVLASLGIEKVAVLKRPIVAVVSTGDELIDISKKPSGGQIRDINSYLLSTLLDEFGCTPKMYGIINDDYDLLYNTVKSAVSECDAVLVSGGSSAGARDMTAKIIDELGEVLIHGLAMKPGKPTIIGKIDNKAVFGLPGHPAACFFVTEIIVKYFLNGCMITTAVNKGETFVLSENISSNNGREEYLCVRTKGNEAAPLYAKSGIISLLSKADGYIKIDRDCEGLKKGETVTVFSL